MRHAAHPGHNQVGQAADGRHDGHRAVAHRRLRHQPARLEAARHQHKVGRRDQQVRRLLGSTPTRVSWFSKARSGQSGSQLGKGSLKHADAAP